MTVNGATQPPAAGLPGGLKCPTWTAKRRWTHGDTDVATALPLHERTIVKTILYFYCSKCRREKPFSWHYAHCTESGDLVCCASTGLSCAAAAAIAATDVTSSPPVKQSVTAVLAACGSTRSVTGCVCALRNQFHRQTIGRKILLG